MTEDLTRYERTIKRVHSFKLKPRYEEAFRTELDEVSALAIAIKTFEKLEWPLCFQGDNSVAAVRIKVHNRYTEEIGIVFENGAMRVESISLKDEYWDRGINSKRVKLFIHAFRMTEKEFDEATLAKLCDDYKRTINWDDYELPEELPKPKKRMAPNVWVVFIPAMIVAAILGYYLAAMIAKGDYVVMLHEIFIFLIITLAFSLLIVISNYTNDKVLKYILLGAVIVTYLSSIFFEYKIVVDRFELHDVGFIDYIKIKNQARFTIDYLNSHPVYLIGGKLFQIVITFYVCYFFIMISLIFYTGKKVPVIVVNFALYHMIKGKNNDEIRVELDKKGWSNKQCQNDVFETIDNMQYTDKSKINKLRYKLGI